MNCNVRRSIPTLFAAVALAALACKGTEPPTTGKIEVTTATTGADVDPDGYGVTLQGDTTHGTSGSTTLPIGVNGKVTFSDVRPGTYSLLLGGAAVNCPIASQNPRGVTVTAGGNAQVAFQIACVQRVDLTGVWNYTSRFGSPLACNDTGSYVLNVTGSGLGGTDDLVGTCDLQDGSIDHSFSGPVTGALSYSAAGAISVSLSVADCSFSADVAGSPPDRLTNGSIQCSSGPGTWTAVRGGGAVTSVSVSPATRSVVAGGTARLRPIMTDASGSRRVGPTVAWTSDAPAIATVDALGVVTGVASGSATITATAESKSGSATVGVGVVTFAAVYAGAYNSCGLTTGGTAYCWGNGTYGQIGDGAKANAFAPELVANLTSLTSITVGGVHSCGLAAGGTAYCWGDDAAGQLGAGTPGAQVCGIDAEPCSSTPLAVAGGHTFSSITAGWVLTCALESSAAFCWGDNPVGGLGDGSTASSRTPVAVTGGIAFEHIVVGNEFACGLIAGGAAYCWGNNSAGELGIGPTGPQVCSSEPCSTAPVAVSGNLTFVALSAGQFHVCGVTSGGAGYCWGDNANGQLGVSTTETCSFGGFFFDCSTTPLPVDGGVAFTSISAGIFHSCGVTATGAGYCWGSNSDGQLGTGTTDFAPAPTLIAGGLSFAAVSAFGRWHSCGLTTGSLAYCWGYNGWGQIGDGTGSETWAPVGVLGQAGAPGPAPLRVAQMTRSARHTARALKPLSSRPPRP
ncbi:MAG TPA: Ig-like domain-containing protein [Gemmatimonadales bacterium]|nr:Ig-like domain-containing protein [Gemmatimonadales bacterium]